MSWAELRARSSGALNEFATLPGRVICLNCIVIGIIASIARLSGIFDLMLLSLYIYIYVLG